MCRRLAVTTAVGLAAGLAGGAAGVRLAAPAAGGAAPPAEAGVFFTAGLCEPGQFPLPAGGLSVAAAVRLVRPAGVPAGAWVQVVHALPDGEVYYRDVDLAADGGRARVRPGDFLMFRPPAD